LSFLSGPEIPTLPPVSGIAEQRARLQRIKWGLLAAIRARARVYLRGFAVRIVKLD
jgi:hypothetical protein